VARGQLELPAIKTNRDPYAYTFAEKLETELRLPWKSPIARAARERGVSAAPPPKWTKLATVLGRAVPSAADCRAEVGTASAAPSQALDQLQDELVVKHSPPLWEAT